MKRVLALCVVMAVCLGTVALAQDTAQKSDKMSGKMMTGTVSKVDNSAKMMTVKDDSGKEWTVYWNADTKVDGGAPTEGATVSFATMEKDGKTWATSIKTTPKY